MQEVKIPLAQWNFKSLRRYKSSSKKHNTCEAQEKEKVGQTTSYNLHTDGGEQTHKRVKRHSSRTVREGCFVYGLPSVPLSCHWKATGHFFGQCIWKILYKFRILKGGRKGGDPLPGPCTTPSRSRFLCCILLHEFSEKVCGCLPVALR